jgi:hypothetical protein
MPWLWPATRPSTHLTMGLNPHWIIREPYIPVVNIPDVSKLVNRLRRSDRSGGPALFIRHDGYPRQIGAGRLRQALEGNRGFDAFGRGTG